MNLSLAKVVASPQLSEETLNFKAELLLDGMRVAHVRNHGTGGAHVYYWEDPQSRRTIEDWVETQTLEFEFEKLDQIVDKLLMQWEMDRAAKRAPRRTGQRKRKTSKGRK